VTTLPIDTDGILPFELIGWDGRFQRFATSFLAGPVPPFVVPLDASGAVPVREYQAPFEAYRREMLLRLAGCRGDFECQGRGGSRLDRGEPASGRLGSYSLEPSDFA
jgi:hypothetical protein